MAETVDRQPRSQKSPKKYRRNDDEPRVKVTRTRPSTADVRSPSDTHRQAITNNVQVSRAGAYSPDVPSRGPTSNAGSHRPNIPPNTAYALPTPPNKIGKQVPLGWLLNENHRLATAKSMNDLRNHPSALTPGTSRSAMLMPSPLFSKLRYMVSANMNRLNTQDSLNITNGLREHDYTRAKVS